jgi:hypothetical protein
VFGLHRYADAKVLGVLAKKRGRLGKVESLEALFVDGGRPMILYSRRTWPIGLVRHWFNLDTKAKEVLRGLLAGEEGVSGDKGALPLGEMGGWGDWIRLEAATVPDGIELTHVRKRFPLPRSTSSFVVEDSEWDQLRRLLR